MSVVASSVDAGGESFGQVEEAYFERNIESNSSCGNMSRFLNANLKVRGDDAHCTPSRGHPQKPGNGKAGRGSSPIPILISRSGGPKFDRFFFGDTGGVAEMKYLMVEREEVVEKLEGGYQYWVFDARNKRQTKIVILAT